MWLWQTQAGEMFEKFEVFEAFEIFLEKTSKSHAYLDIWKWKHTNEHYVW